MASRILLRALQTAGYSVSGADAVWTSSAAPVADESHLTVSRTDDLGSASILLVEQPDETIVIGRYEGSSWKLSHYLRGQFADECVANAYPGTVFEVLATIEEWLDLSVATV